MNSQEIWNWTKKNSKYLWPLIILLIGWIEYSFQEALLILIIVYLYILGTFEVLNCFIHMILNAIQFKSVKNSFQKNYTSNKLIFHCSILLGIVLIAKILDNESGIRIAIVLGVTLAILVHVYAVIFSLIKPPHS